MSVFFLVDDKHVPLYRVMWVAATPHFCGADDCEREGLVPGVLKRRIHRAQKIVCGQIASNAFPHVRRARSRGENDEASSFRSAGTVARWTPIGAIAGSYVVARTILS